MPEPNAGIQSFLPWVRQGLTSLPAETLPANLPAPAAVTVELKVAGGAPIRQQMRTYGPADVLGIDPRHIIRTEPANLARNFEPNFLAAVEFDRPDFPWLFTPASPNAKNQLRPWLCLIVVREQSGVEILTGPDRPLPVLEIKTPARPSAELPNLAESWAWAHGQIVGRIAGVPLGQIEAESPERTLSRLICPRRLQPSTRYHACLVPAFLQGVNAGRGLPPAPAEQTSTPPAWQPNAASVLLPIYYRWQFSTGEAGDFASLVKLITLYTFPANSGSRNLDVGRAGQRLPAAPAGSADATVGLESALVPIGTQVRPWNNTFSAQFRAALAGLLEVAADSAADPLVTAPLYAGQQANQRRLPPEGAPPSWFRELNLHPGYRSIAGWGARVVQNQQEALMASAWEQVGEIERANSLLRHGQLVREAARGVYQRHLTRMAPSPLLQLSRPIHARVAVSPQTTMQKVLLNNKMPLTVVTPEFRRASRPRGPMLRSVLPAAQRTMRQMVTRIATNSVTMVIPRPLVQTITPELIESQVPTPPVRPPNAPPVAFISIQSSQMSKVGPRPRFVPRPPELPGTTVVPVKAPTTNENEDSPHAKNYRAAITAHQFLLGPVLQIFVPDLPILQMDTVTPMVLDQLKPAVSVSAFMQPMAKVAGQTIAGDDLEPVAAAPEFPQPMYAPLRDLAPDLIAPGISQVPDNKVAVLQTNPRFIESYMAGLNHEMSRELLWRGFPTDQRGTYFIRFWDTRGRPESLSRSAAGDIPPIHLWPGSKHLGEIASGGTTSMVLLIKAELMRRYPNAVVYAVAATIPQGQTKPRLGAQETHPIFRGTIDGDTSFFGFPLSVALAVGTGTPTSPGFFFVIQEHPSEPRFGLPANAPPDTPLQPRADSAATAVAFLQRPVRLAIHAADLLKGITF
jgi:hypothetical protein